MKIKLVLLMVAMVILLTGCSRNVKLAVKDTESTTEAESVTEAEFGIDNLEKLGEFMYYDVVTGVVYWWNGLVGGHGSTTPSPYYAPNGLPYRYNAETKTMEEIQ